MTSQAGEVLAAIDIGGTKTLVLVVPANAVWSSATEARRDARRAVRFATERQPAQQIRRVADVVRRLANGRTIGAVGVAAPGPLDHHTGRVLHSPNLGWKGFDLGVALAEELSAPVSVDDDANAGAIGEALVGAGRGADPVAYLTVSTGIGAGIVIDGRIVRGAHQVAGEIGHLVIDPSGPRCGCGGRGHVEAYAGGDALASRAKAAWPTGVLVDGSPAPTDARGLVKAALSGDPTAERLLSEAAEALAFAIAVLWAAIDPEQIAVGGSIGLRQRWLIRDAVRRARRRLGGLVGRPAKPVAAALGASAPLVGAAMLARERAGLPSLSHGGWQRR
jgi:glucokinase